MNQTKLTLVSVSYKGRRKSVFVNAPIIEGKAVVSPRFLDKLAEKAGAMARGSTFTIG